MRRRVIAAVSITASLLLAAAPPSFAQSQLPRPGQLPPAGGQQRAPAAAPPQRGRSRRSSSRSARPSPTSRWRSARPRR